MAWTAERLPDENKPGSASTPSLRVPRWATVCLFHGSPIKQSESVASRRLASSPAGERRGRRPLLLRATPRAWHASSAVPLRRCGRSLRDRRRLASSLRVVYIVERTSRGFRRSTTTMSVVRDMAAVGRSIDLLREPPAVHPHLRPRPRPPSRAPSSVRLPTRWRDAAPRPSQIHNRYDVGSAPYTWRGMASMMAPGLHAPQAAGCGRLAEARVAKKGCA